jgi:hypothetical protein
VTARLRRSAELLNDQFQYYHIPEEGSIKTLQQFRLSDNILSSDACSSVSIVSGVRAGRPGFDFWHSPQGPDGLCDPTQRGKGAKSGWDVRLTIQLHPVRGAISIISP